MSTLSAPASSARLLPPGDWRLDSAAASVTFRVRHLGVATVVGHFTDITAAIDDDGISGGVAVASVATGHPVRDARLRDELFDAARFPVIAVHAPAPLRPAMHAAMTIRDVTRPVRFEVATVLRADGTVQLHATARISRKAFGLDWSALVDAGRLIVSDRVDVEADIVLVRA